MNILEKLKNRISGLVWSSSNPVSSYHLYEKMLIDIPDGSSVLDVSIGDGVYFTNPNVIQIIKDKGIIIRWINSNQSQVEICKARVELANVGSLVNAECADLLTTTLTEQFDYALFMQVFPAIDYLTFNFYIKCITGSVRNKILMCHNLVQEKSNWLSWIKSNSKYLTMINLGRLISVKEMEDYLYGLGFKSFELDMILSVKYSDIVQALNVFRSLGLGFLGNKRCEQYLISISLVPLVPTID